MEAENRPNRPRLMIDISPDLRRRIRIAAAQKDLSIREYIEDILEKTVPQDVNTSQQERHPMTRETFEGLLLLREQIKRNHPGQTFEDSTDIIRQMREERSQCVY